MSDEKPENGWERHQAEQRRAWLKLTPMQRLLWLEDAKRFAAMALGAARKRPRPPTETS